MPKMIDRKKIIRLEAAKMFYANGYKSSTMRDLADKAGLKQASSIYNHYPSKAVLLKDICFRAAHRFVRGTKEISETSTNELFRLEKIIELHVRIAREEPSSAIVFSKEWKNLEKGDLEEFLNLRREYESYVHKTIVEGIETKKILNLHPEVIFQTFFSSLRWIHYVKQDDIEENALLSGIRVIMMRGISIH